MPIFHLYQFLMAPVDSTTDDKNRKTAGAIVFWFTLSLAFAIYYGILGLRQAFDGEYVVQDDAREYVFWMQQFIDPELFPNDLIVTYFKSITPPGYAAIYFLMAKLGITPLLLSKLLPIVLSLIVTCYGFATCLQLLPMPITGFITTLLLNQSLWFKDDLSSAVPRAFVYPLFLAFLYYLLRQSKIAIGLIICLQAFIYPPLLFISLGVLFLRSWNWQGWQPQFDRSKILFFFGITGLAMLALLPYAIAASQFGPVVTAAQAQMMPELWKGGRHGFYDPNPWRFWLLGRHSGIIPRRLTPFLLWTGLLLPIGLRDPNLFPLFKQVKPSIHVLAQIVLVSVSLFLLAHAVLLKLFFPTRYTTHTLQIVLAFSAGILLTAILDRLLRSGQRFVKLSQWVKWFSAVGLMAAIGAAIMVYPTAWSGNFLSTNYRAANEEAVFEFLQQQSKDTLIASLSKRADDIPTFAQRSILAGREYALPFHLGYYRQIQQRVNALIEAQYHPALAPAKQLIQQYGVDFWMLDKRTFTPRYLSRQDWLTSFQPVYTEALTRLQQGNTPALAKLQPRCTVLEGKSVILMSANCILNSPEQ
jgi:hypothetical protein